MIMQMGVISMIEKISARDIGLSYSKQSERRKK